MALEDEHGGRVTPEEAGRTAYYRGEGNNPYPVGHVYHPRWQAAYVQAAAVNTVRELAKIRDSYAAGSPGWRAAEAQLDAFIADRMKHRE